MLSWTALVLPALLFALPAPAAEPPNTLRVVADFEGASVQVLRLDQQTRTVEFAPGGDPAHGWPCWWYFRLDGVAPEETVTLRLRGSEAALDGQRPLSASWAMAARATYSLDGKTWQHTPAGERDGEWMVYQVAKPAGADGPLFVAWGPPFTHQDALTLVEQAGRRPYAEAKVLCRSRGGRKAPLLHVREGDRADKQRFGVWVQARQHAWESGSSWVARGFMEWLLQAQDDDAAWLRRHADIFIVPVMDVDNVATGNGGKNALPHDHNRDWSPQPHWNEVRAAQQRVSELIDADRMDVFLDLHNPAPGDPAFFYVMPRDALKPAMLEQRDEFLELAYAHLRKIKPSFPLSSRPKVTGPGYHPLWRQISSNWVTAHGNPHTVSLCLETAWNTKRSTTEGYRSVGAGLGATVADFLRQRPER